jgi:hypothetical protein
MNPLVSEIIFTNDTVFADLNKKELINLINNTSLSLCMLNKNIKQTAQYWRVTHMFNSFQNTFNINDISLKTPEDNILFNMLLIAEFKEMIYDSTHDFYFDKYHIIEKLDNTIQERCTSTELQEHLYDPTHFIFEGRKYGFYKLQKRGKNTLVY